ncbi:MAG: FAD/NAD(P)-binding protein [Brachybacterium sp.]|nr:FAD/NAD(P)-binding protein [Brachybacterium sp.]
MTTDQSALPRTIAVLGGGPRGIAVVERLIANAQQLDVPRLRVLLVEPHRPGGGRIWDPDQPSHLLMNTLCADATHFTDSTVELQGPVRPGPTLYDWARGIVADEITDLGSAQRPLDEEHRAEALGMLPHSHPSRRFLGGYLEWCHAKDLAEAPTGIEVENVHGTATSLEPDGKRWRVEVHHGLLPSDPGADPSAPDTSFEADAVVIATGHADAEITSRGAALSEAASTAGLWHGRPTSPISQHDLDALVAGEPVIVRGLGMNFFDYVSLLTLGRGGTFEADTTGRDALVYVPSGKEPHLVVGSGRGIPYRAKGRFGTMTPIFSKRYQTPELLAELRECAESGPGVDFMTDLYPAIMKDSARLYYSMLAQQRPDAFAEPVQNILDALDEYDWASAELEQIIIRSAPDAGDRLQVRALDRPLDGVVLDSPEELRRWWLEDLRHDVHQADIGMDSALKCASVQIGAGRGPLRTLVRYGGVRGSSYRDHVEGWFRGFAGMLASGPPARRIDELIALVEAGVVQPLGARMNVEVREGRFVATSASVPGHEHHARALLEAHLPPATLRHSANPLLRDLRESGRARPFEIPDVADPEAPGIETGAIEVGPPPYRVLDEGGAEQAGLYAVGVPLESLLWGTQLQPLAHTNSRFLREIDEVSRDALVPGVDRCRASEAADPETDHSEESV